jgi:TRAP-type mannitol/chloroaromatic compound transport system permease small subunit
MSAFIRVIDGISELAGKLCAWMFFAIGLFITYEIIVRNDAMRALFGTAPTIWVDEISRVMQVWAAYLAAAYVLKHREMVTIEIAFNDRTSLPRRLAETLALIMLFIFAGVAAYYGFGLWLKSTLAGHTTDSFLAPPKWLTHGSIWIGFGLLFLQGLAELYKIWMFGIPAKTDDPLQGSH